MEKPHGTAVSSTSSGRVSRPGRKHISRRLNFRVRALAANKFLVTHTGSHPVPGDRPGSAHAAWAARSGDAEGLSVQYDEHGHKGGRMTEGTAMERKSTRMEISNFDLTPDVALSLPNGQLRALIAPGSPTLGEGGRMCIHN